MIKFNKKLIEGKLPESIDIILWNIINKLEKEFDIHLSGSNYMGIDYNLSDNPKLKSDVDFNLVKEYLLKKGEWELSYKKDLKKIHFVILNETKENDDIKINIYPGLIKLNHPKVTIDISLTYKIENKDWVLDNKTGIPLESHAYKFYEDILEFTKDENKFNTLKFIKAWIAIYRPINIKLPKGMFITTLVMSNYENGENLFKTICKTLANMKSFINKKSNFENDFLIYKNLKLVLNSDLDNSLNELSNIIDHYLELEKKYGTIKNEKK